MKLIANILVLALTVHIALVRADRLINQLRMLKSESEEEQLHKIGACISECLAKTLLMDKCYKTCTLPGALDRIAFQYPVKEFEVELVCRDSTNLLVNVRSEETPNSTNIYVVKLQNGGDKFYFMSNNSLVKLEHLVPNGRFKVSATVLSSNHEYNTAAAQTFRTLPLNYETGEITELDIVDYRSNAHNKSLLDALIAWKPAADRSCHYELLYYANQAPNNELKQFTFEQSTVLYQHTITSLLLNTEYEIAIRSTNPLILPWQTELHWQSFNTPGCAVWFNASQQCAPEAPSNIHVITRPFGNEHYQVNISWNEPQFPPDYYVVKVFDLYLLPTSEEEPVNSAERNVTGTETSILIDSFPVQGPQIEVLIIAYANGQFSPAQSVIRPVQATRPAALEAWSSSWIAALILAVIFALVSVFFTFMLKPRRDQQSAPDVESNYSIQLNSTVPVAFPVVAFVDEMEIESDRIKLLEVLGEGAFGVVRRGQLDQTDVAVKMLKGNANVQSVKEFRREIEVMKSVGSHPNVVGIVGHFTKRDQDMMLLTEYCSEGNLLNYLRNEWHKIMQSKVSALATPEYLDCRTPCLNGDKRPVSVFNFDTSFVNEKMSVEYKNICTVAFENKLYPMLNAIDEENNNTKQFNAVQNQCYYKDNTNMTCAHLLSFAQQIATGMEFLARNKVVHRDLAARNVLLCANRVAKIADFGLSRDIYQENLYRKKGSAKLPIKWLALESLTHQLYTAQSDVWSYGVLLYEICTLGGNPYPHLTAGNLIAALKQGYRMERPSGCSEQLYELMESCWRAMPIDRPNFSGILERLDQIGKSNVNPIEVDAIVEMRNVNVAIDDRSYLKPVGGV